MKMMSMRLPLLRGRTRPPIRRSTAVGIKVLVVAVTAVLALVFGAAAALFGGVPALTVLMAILPLILTLVDYRFGVVALTILLPWSSSPLLPQAQGLNIVNYFTLASTVSFGAQYVIRRKPVVQLPQILWWCYLVPLSIGILVALPHIREGGINIGGDDLGGWEPVAYLKGHYIKPLFLVLYAFLLANAVRASKRVELWLAVFGVSALVPVTAVVGLIAMYRVSLVDLQALRGFMEPLGHHANGMAWMLASLVGPLLYMAAAARGWARILLLVPTIGVGTALLLTFSRAGFLALLVVLAMFAINRKRLSAFLLVTVLVAAILLAIPAVRDRAFTGFEAGTPSGSTSRVAIDEVALTAGRLSFWPLLAREVKRSPIWGRGIGSTAWSDAAHRGFFKAVHPHNLYLLLAMDLGLVGLGLVMYLYYRVGRAYLYLSREPSLSASTHAFFAGSLASMVGCGVMGMTGGRYEPLPESTFLWFSLGMAMTWWPLTQGARGKAVSQSWVFGIRPLAKRQPIASEMKI